MRPVILATSLSILLILLLISVQESQSSPAQFSKWLDYIKMSNEDIDFHHSKDNQCRHGGDVRNLCEKCTKVTKNEVVFPLCCLGRRQVADWCRRFLEYKPSDSYVTA